MHDYLTMTTCEEFRKMHQIPLSMLAAYFPMRGTIFSLPVVTVVRYQHIWPWLFGHHLELILIPLNKLTCNSIALYTSMYIYRTMILRITLPGYIGQVTFSRWNMTRKQTKIHSNFISTYLYILYNILSHEYVKN